MRHAPRTALLLVPLVAVGVLAGASPNAYGSAEAARDRAVDAKVDALLAKMTLQEKLGQLQMAGGDENGKPVDALFTQARNGEIGSTLGVRGAANVNSLQKAALQSRLHIPLIFAFDTIHGYRTVFPTPLAGASTWDPALAQANESVAADESSAAGVKWTFAPMVDVTHDARWGRIVEGNGEDPYLGSAFAAAKVRGFQGSDYSKKDKVAATVKHFAAYGAVEAGRDYNTADVSVERLNNMYFPPYEAAVKAGAATVMTSFNDINGVPATGDRDLLTGTLRHRWGFKGAVVSDYDAVHELVPHGFAADDADAARLALPAGNDIEMVSTAYADHVADLVKDGSVPISAVDTAVRRVLRFKYLAGVFDHPYADPKRESTSLLSAAHRAAARTAAGRSIVLLRNEKNALPLSAKTSSLAVVGPLADSQDDMLGSWSGDGQATDVVTPLAGIQAAAPDAKVTYAAGCDAECKSTDGFGAATDAAKASDVTVVVVGEPRAWSGESTSRATLGLPGHQLDLVKAVAATGKPYVVVLSNGHPLVLGGLTSAPALVEAWQGGTEAGNGLADVLFGKVNPSGKLPVSFPRAVGQEPLYYDHRSTGRPSPPDDLYAPYTSRYIDVKSTPLYPFGYGLSYTTFAVGDPKLSKARIGANGTVTVRATVKNTGSTAGADVVQLYLHDKVASITQPVKKLRGFARVQLNPGQSRTVSFTLDRKDLGFYDNAARFWVEPGDFDVYVGDTSTTTSAATLTVTR